MEYELEDVERDYIEFRKEIGEETHRKRWETAFRKCDLCDWSPKSITLDTQLP